MKILHLCDKTAFSIWQSFVLLSGNLSKFQFNFICLQNDFQTGQKHNINHAGKQCCPKRMRAMRSLKPSPIKSPSPKIPNSFFAISPTHAHVLLTEPGTLQMRAIPRINPRPSGKALTPPPSPLEYIRPPTVHAPPAQRFFPSPSLGTYRDRPSVSPPV